MSYHQIEEGFNKVKLYVKRTLGFSASVEEDHTERRRQFAAAPAETRYNLISAQLNIFTGALSEKSSILPVIATLAATLIVVATLNQNLVPLGLDDTKIILSIFLLLIPITLGYYIKIKEGTAKGAMEIIRSYQPKSQPLRPTFGQYFASDFPMIVIYIFGGIILYILFKMWSV